MISAFRLNKVDAVVRVGIDVEDEFELFMTTMALVETKITTVQTVSLNVILMSDSSSMKGMVLH